MSEDAFVSLANQFGTEAQKLKDQVRESDGIITSLQRELQFEREQNSTHVSVIADLRNELDGVRNTLSAISGEYRLHVGALIECASVIRERLAQTRQEPAKVAAEKPRLNGAPQKQQQLPPLEPYPRVVSAPRAVG